MLELGTKLKDFVEICMKVSNYQQIVKDKYKALNFLESSQVAKIIEKFKRKHSNITLV